MITMSRSGICKKVSKNIISVFICTLFLFGIFIPLVGGYGPETIYEETEIDEGATLSIDVNRINQCGNMIAWYNDSSNSYIYLAYLKGNPSSYSGYNEAFVIVNQSSDGGATWTKKWEVDLRSLTQYSGFDDVKVAVSQSGRLYVVMGWNYDSEIYVMISNTIGNLGTNDYIGRWKNTLNWYSSLCVEIDLEDNMLIAGSRSGVATEKVSFFKCSLTNIASSNPTYGITEYTLYSSTDGADWLIGHPTIIVSSQDLSTIMQKVITIGGIIWPLIGGILGLNRLINIELKIHGEINWFIIFHVIIDCIVIPICIYSLLKLRES